MNKNLWVLLLGFIILASACGINSLPSKDPWYAKHYYIMHDYERETYKHLTPEGKLEFQKLFWEARQPVAKEQFDNRMSYIEKVYKTENHAQPWNTDRGRVYLLNGPPASIDYKQNTDWVMQAIEGGRITGAQGGMDRTKEDIQANLAEIWVYPYKSFFVYYVFTFSPPNTWKLNPSTFQNNRYLEQLENMNKDLTFALKDEEDYKAKLSALPRKK
ncbi:MAG: GWxTD domain-containing protein [Candidatus Aminicenantes bacterium]|nr:GWxTD domain-containing protein [Candidatus Aminicenantes bacterium]